jgi:phospholipid/cholesterol/gamma-HCH transport system substrate-binding protein
MNRKVILGLVVIAGLAVRVLFLHARLSAHNLELKAYFADAQGLRPGAPVTVAGVTVGSVTTVQAHPSAKQNPAEVVMFISTPYELKIPADSTVSLATAGVLGETYAEIDVKGTSGPRPRMVLY